MSTPNRLLAMAAERRCRRRQKARHLDIVRLLPESDANVNAEPTIGYGGRTEIEPASDACCLLWYFAK
jgi:hypothetical protein